MEKKKTRGNCSVMPCTPASKIRTRLPHTAQAPWYSLPQRSTHLNQSLQNGSVSKRLKTASVFPPPHAHVVPTTVQKCETRGGFRSPFCASVFSAFCCCGASSHDSGLFHVGGAANVVREDHAPFRSQRSGVIGTATIINKRLWCLYYPHGAGFLELISDALSHSAKRRIVVVVVVVQVCTLWCYTMWVFVNYKLAPFGHNKITLGN